ncbi:hypothetical protein LCGC14_2266060, partial [marine sediment metagenome]
MVFGSGVGWLLSRRPLPAALTVVIAVLLLAPSPLPTAAALGAEEQAFLGQGAPDPLEAQFGGGGGPPGVSTVLSRLELGGSAEGGAQT